MRIMDVFYRDFAAAYGTCHFLALIASLAANQRINVSFLGLFAFPLIASVYAWVRYPHGVSRAERLRQQLRQIEAELARVESTSAG